MRVRLRASRLAFGAGDEFRAGGKVRARLSVRVSVRASVRVRARVRVS